ncbi:MAG: AAA family ATPase [Ardenticatenaceae bacterium]
MINGSFGVGKTTTAQVLVERLANAMLFDPEDVGRMVRHITRDVRYAAEETDDFQDIALWRSLTVAVAEHLYRQYRRTLIVPMTLTNPAYFHEIRSGFTCIGPPVYYFCLTASLTTIHRRLIERGDVEGAWPWRKAGQCVPALSGPPFEEYISTEGRSVEEVVADILCSLPAVATSRI